MLALEHAVDRCGMDSGEAEAELAQLATDGGPLRRELARIAGRVVETQAWAALGFVRLGDYGRECVGLSARELSELARVDAKLATLPRLEEQLVRGALGWTAVRLLCRVAMPDDEASWIAAAGEMSTSELALRVRGSESAARDVGSAAAGCASPEASDEATVARLGIACSQRVTRKWGDVRRLLRRTTGEWLPWSVCAEYVAAEVMSGLPVPYPEPCPDSQPEPQPDPQPTGIAVEASSAGMAVDRARVGAVPLAARAVGMACRDAGRTPLGDAPRSHFGSCVESRVESHVESRFEPPLESRFVRALRDGLGEADAFELDRRLRRATALERGLLCRMGPLLRAVADAKGYRSLGLRSLDDYAREWLGMAPRKARALLRVERACCRSTALREAWQAGRISWSQVQTLVAVVIAPDGGAFAAAWIERAARVSVRRLADDVEDALEHCDLDPARLPALPELRVRAPEAGSRDDRAPEGVQTRARPTPWRERSRVVVVSSPEVVRLFRACLATVQLALEQLPGRGGRPVSPGEALEAMCDHVIEVWSAPERRLPAWERRARRVYERDGWRCVVPGCHSYRNLHAHHIRFRSLGGGDELGNLATLCAAHHQRGVHGGRIRIHGTAPHALRFEMPLGSWRSGDVKASSATASRNSRAGAA